MDVRTPLFQNIACVLIGVLFLNPLVATAAQLTVDAQAGGNTGLAQAGNGVPIVNIATPNGSGLSHNKFGEYNVGQQGLILNNATAQLQATQLGGLIVGNPNLKGQAAGLILNEVTGANTSQLKGYTEVAGKSAAVIVANPHGITCDGCGFINTPRVTLSTGKPIVENGRLDRFDVNGGQISIQGAGLNASNIEQFDLITRSAQINAELYANKLNVITGRNQVRADDLAVTAKAADGSVKPQLAIDSSALGGMYAGAIRLVGTEAGVGVKLAGDMATSAGDIQIDANGQLSLAQTVASQNLKIQAQGVNLTGKTYAGGNVDIRANSELANRKSLAAAGSIALQGGQLINQGVIEAGVNPDNSRNLIGDVKLSGDSLRNSGSVIASRELSSVLDGQLDNRAGTLSGKTTTSLTAGSLNNGSDGRVLSQGSLTIGADALDNRGGLIASAKGLSVMAGADLHNQGGEISSQTAVTLKGQKLNNQGGLIAADSHLQVTVGELDNSAKGTLNSQGTLSVQAQELDNRQGGLLSSKGSMTLTDAALDNQGGVIVAEQQLSIDGKSLDNRGGLVSGKADLSVSVDTVLDNRSQGTVVADGKLTVAAAELRNGDRGQVTAKGDLEIEVGALSQQGDADTATQAGELLSQGKLTLVAERIDNRQGGLIAASKGLDIQSSELLRNGGGEISTQGQASVRVKAAGGQPAALLDNSGAGTIIGDQGLTLAVQRLLNNAKGLLAGRDSLLLVGDSLDNRDAGTLSSQQALSVQLTGELQNQVQGALLSGGSLTVGAASLNNSADGLLSSAGKLEVGGGSLNNQGGKLVSDGQLTISNSSLDNSNSGIISAKQALTIGTGQLDNQSKGLITTGTGLTVTAGQINNYEQGLIAAKGDAQVTATGLDQHDHGELISEAALTLDLQGGALNNSQAGLIATPGALLLNNLGAVNNSAGGEISSSQSFLLKASQLNNSAGRVISGQDLQLQITQALLNNLKGVLSAAKLTVAAASLDNSAAGVLASKGDIQVSLTGKLDNHDQGTLSAAQALTIASASLDNSNDGLLASGGALLLNTGAANNQSGTIASQTTLNATTDDFDNRGGVVSSQLALTLTADAVDNRDNGLITSAAGLTLTADRLDSSRELALTGGEVSAKGDLYLTVSQLIQQQGRLIGEAGVRVDFNGGDLDNRGGLLSATGPLTLLNLGKLDNRNAGEVSSSQSYSIAASAIDNGEQGRLISAGSLSLDVGSGQLRNATGGLISGWQGLTVSAGNLDNSALGTLSSRNGALTVALSGSERVLNNSGAGALVSKGKLTVDAGSLNNSNKGILSSEGDLELSLSGALNNSGGGLIDSQGALSASAGAVNNQTGQIGSLKAASLNASSLDNRAGQLSSNAALNLTLSGNLINTQQAKLASAGPLVLKAAAIDNQGGSLVSQNLLDLTASSLNNANGGTVAARNGLSLLLTGALNNSADGLIHSQLGALDIRAQSLNNQGGTLSSQGNLTLNLNGTLNNQSGHIQSRAGNLDLQKSSAVDNSAGVLSSLAGWLKLVTAGLFDNDAGTLQAQSVAIDAQGADNRGGHISALSGGTTIDIGSATFNNQGGGLYAHQLLDLVAGNFNNQGAASGQGGKVAAGQIDFGLSGALTNRYGILESASTLRLAAASIDNQFGSLRALGSSGTTLIRGGLLDNRNGLIETANSVLQLDVSDLQNEGGIIRHVGTGTFGLAAANVMAAGGTLSSNGVLGITANSWVNSSVLQAGTLNLNIGTFTQTASGQLLAGQSFTGSGTNWVNHGLLASDGNFSLNLSGAYSGNGQATSLGTLSLSAGSIDISSSARISGGGLTTVTSNGLLSNLGKLTSAGDLTVTANTLNNYGTLGSAEKLRINAPTLLNENGLIFSGEDMTLRVNSFTNRYADVYSLGALSIARDDTGSQLSVLENRSGSIEAVGDMSLRAATFTNRKELFTMSKEQTYGHIHVVCYDCSGDHHNVDYVATERFETELEEDSAAAQIYSGGNLDIRGGTIVNRYSSLSAAGDIAISATTLENSGAALGLTERVRRFNTGRITDGTDERFRSNYINPYNALPLPKETPSNLYRWNLVSDIETQSNTGVAASAIIQAGGNISIQATQTLENSVVRERHLQGGGANLVVDSTAPGTGRSVVVQLNSQLPPNLQQQQVNPLTLPGFSLPQGENGLFRLSGQGAANGAATAAQGAVADNTLGGSAVTVGNGLQAQGPAPATGSTWDVQSGQDGNSTGATPTNAAALALVGVQSLPGRAVPSTSHKYLIETNPELTNLKQFLGSDYMLGSLGYTPDNTQKRLGDGLYEQRLIREAVVARTGQRFLAGLNSDEAMFRYLMDNAIASKQALQLSVGISLTAAQVAALTHDIVWMEEYEVAGEKVLVPVLYLAQAEGRLAPNGALIQGQDVSLISGGSLINQGTLRASNNLSAVAGGSIGNSGLIEAGKRLDLLATDSIRNAQGGIIAGRDVSLTALTGDVINERTITQESRSGRNFSQLTSVVDSAARIEASHDLSLVAGRDIQNIGGALAAAGRAQLEGARDVLIASAEAENGQMRKDKRHFWSNSRTTQYGSDVQIGGDLSAEAGQDLAVIASKVKAGGDVDLLAGGDVLIGAAANESSSEYRYKSSKKKINKEDASVRQQGAEIEAGGNLLVIADNDLTLSASKLKAGEEAYLYAGSNLSLLTEANQDYSFYSKTKKKTGSFGSRSKKSSLRESESTTSVGSSVTANNAVLTAGQDLRVIGSSVEARAGDVSLSAANDILIGHALDRTETRQASSSSKSSWGGLKSSKLKHDVKESSTQAVGSLISGDNVDLQAGRDVQVTGSGVVSTDDLNILAARDITIDAATNTFTRDEKHKSKNRDLTGLATGNNLGLDDITGNQHLSISKGKGNSQAEETTLTGSTVGSSEGSVSLTAGRKIGVVASDLVSTKDMSLTASDVNIVAGIETAKQSSKNGSSSLAVGRVVGGSVVDTVQSIYDTAKAANEAEDSRLKAVKTAQALLSAYSAVQQGDSAAANIADGKPANSSGSLIKIGTEVAHTRSKSSSQYSAEQVKQSNLNSGGTLSIVASGAEASSNGDIHIVGSALKAADTELLAKRDIVLESAQNSAEWNNQSKTNRTSVGASFNIGQQNGFTLDLGAKLSGNTGKGHDITQVNSTLDTGSLLLVSGKDTTLAGAQVRADKVEAAIGGDLNIASRQDEAKNKNEQKSAGFGASICIPPFCYGATVSGSASLAGGKSNTDYQAVTEQSGIYVGKGGYDITVGDTTRLQGAVIASEATADKNRLSTDRLEHSDIRNRSEIKSQSASLSVSYSSSGETKGGDSIKAESALGGGLPLALTESERSTTRSAVSEGTIEVRSADGANELSGLSRETAGANQQLDRPDEKAMQERMDLIQSTAALGQSVVSTISQAKQKDAQEKLKQAEKSGSPADVTAARVAMEEARRWDVGGDMRLFANITTGLLAAGLGGTGAGTTAGIVANTTAADTFKRIGDYADKQSKTATDEATKAAWAEGGIARILLHATAGAIQGLAGGSVESGALGAGLSAAVMPAIGKALEGSGLSVSDRDALATLIATGMGVAAGSGDGTVGQVVAGSSAGNVDLYNRQLHAAERKALETEAKRLAEQTGSTVSSSGVTWEDLLLLAAGAELDAAENARLQSILGQYGEGNPEADTFARDFLVAAGIMQELASRNIPLTWSDGKPIVAHGETVYAFQATTAQFNDSTLFKHGAQYQSQQSSIWLGDELVPELWKKQFGEREAARYLNEILRNSTSQAEFDDAVQRVSVVASGGVLDVTWDADAVLLLAGGGGALQAARNVLAKRAVGAKGTATAEVPATSAIARDGLRNDLAAQAGIPRSLDKVWGASVDDLAQAYKMDGATLVPKPALSGTSGKAQAFTVEGHPTIKEVQVHPGGGTHGAPYYKFTYKDGVEVRVIDPASGFKPGTITSTQQYFDTTGNRLRYEAGQWKSWE